MKRIFVAIDISEEARNRTASYLGTLRRDFTNLRVGWEKPEKLHLTLKFFGDTSEEQLAALENIVRDAAARTSNFRLQIAKTGVFPNSRNARVLWIDVIDEEGKLPEINEVIEAECEKIGFRRESRAFKPHLTIARLKEPAQSRELIKTHLEAKFEPVGFDVSEIVIYESILKPTGSIYQKVSVFELRLL